MKWYIFSRFKDLQKSIKMHSLYLLLISFYAIILLFIELRVFIKKEAKQLKILNELETNKPKIQIYKVTRDKYSILKSPLAQRQWAIEQYGISFFVINIFIKFSDFFLIRPINQLHIFYNFFPDQLLLRLNFFISKIKLHLNLNYLVLL